MNILSQVLEHDSRDILDGKVWIVEINEDVSNGGTVRPICRVVVSLEKGEKKEVVSKFSRDLTKFLETYDTFGYSLIGAAYYRVSRPYSVNRT